VSVADEFQEKSKYEDSQSEVSDRKRKNEQSVKKYEEAHEKWESDKQVSMYGYENLTQYAKDRALKEFLAQEPEPIKPELISEKIKKTIIEKTARLFTISHEGGFLMYGMQYIEKAHAEIAKFFFELLPVIFEKNKVANELVSFSVIGETIDYKVSNAEYMLDNRKIESFARLRKVVQDLKEVVKKTKATMDAQKIQIERLGSEVMSERAMKVAIQETTSEEEKDWRYFKKLVFLGLDKVDYAKALEKMRACLEVEGKTEEEINNFIEETKKHIGRDI
jgi:hypothetical protein